MGTRTPGLTAAIDTNVLISGLFWGGAPARLLDAVAHGTVGFVTSDELLLEFDRVLHYPKFHRVLTRVENARLETFFSVLAAAQLIEVKRPVPALIPGEPLDNELVEIALAARTSALISGDRHLLDLATHVEIPILTPAQFARQFLV